MCYKLFLSVFTVILLREIFPTEDSDFSCVMIRDVGEDSLSPALRDIDREREREGGGGRGRSALDKLWLRLLCVVCRCRGGALKVKNFLYD